MKYHKIDSIFKRDDNGTFTDEYTNPEFEYLKDNTWIGTEKIDGTNIRFIWDGDRCEIKGRKEGSKIPQHLYEKLVSIKQSLDWSHFNSNNVILFGEGYGHKINGGEQYLGDDVDFILFDVFVNGWWLKREDVKNVGKELGLNVVPVRLIGTLAEAIDITRQGFDSLLADCKAEGLVLIPAAGLLARSGRRIITKVKTKDFT